jgi:hypothetical protein
MGAAPAFAGTGFAQTTVANPLRWQQAQFKQAIRRMPAEDWCRCFAAKGWKLARVLLA